MDVAPKCFLCDHGFVDGEEPWLIFEQRVNEDEQMKFSLADLLSSIFQHQIEEDKAHSTLMCDSCNADILEYESLERRFRVVRERIMTYCQQNMNLNNLFKILPEEKSTIGVLNLTPVYDCSQSSNELFHAKTISTDMYIMEDFANDDHSHIESSNTASGDSNSNMEPIEDSIAFEAFNEHVAQNSLPSGVLHLSNNYDDLSMNNSTDIQSICPEEIIIYDASVGEASPWENIEYSDLEKNNITSYSNDKIFFSSDCPLVDISNSTHTEDEDISNIIPPLSEDSENKEICDAPAPICKRINSDYICLLCNDNSLRWERKKLGEHLQTIHNSKFFMCALCHLGYSERQELKKHENSEHMLTDLSYHCKICEVTFPDRRQLRIHRRIHNTTSNTHECQICHKTYNSKGMLEAHMNNHTGARPYKCTECSKDFASRYTLQSHLKTHTDRKRPFKCDQCDKAFFNQQNLKQHKKLHVSVKEFICSMCPKTFVTQHGLNVHMVTHSGQKPFICRTCGKSFARRPEIKDHERIHTGERPFKCDMCPMAFAQRSNLTSHKKSTHFNEKLHKCDKCDRSFKRKRLLHYHELAVHTGERPHKCSVCGAGFVYPEHYKKHILIHSGSKPYACELCGRQFSSRDNRNAHRFVHSEKKLYECMECGAGFMRKPLLLAHMKQTKHVNDTIIVNQPQFMTSSTIATSIATTTSITTSQSNISDCIDFEQTIDDCVNSNLDSITNILPETNNVYEVDVVNMNTACDRNAQITTIDNELINDEQMPASPFDYLDQDGNETLTWVDIEGEVKD